MSQLIQSIDKQTKLAGENRLELLLFELKGKQLYGINVFKIKEIIENIQLTNLPYSNSIVRGIASIRGQTISIIDLSLAIGYETQVVEDCCIIITEYNRSVQGFLVSKVNKIVNLEWTEVYKPPAGSGTDHFLTAVSQIDDQLVEVIDIEKVLAKVDPVTMDAQVDDQIQEKAKEIVKDNISYEVKDEQGKTIQDDEGNVQIANKKILICDDSKIARKQLQRTLSSINVEVVEKNDGKEMLDYLVKITENEDKLPEEYLLLISDIEMPEMDGYKLTTEIRNHSKLKDMYIILHSSLSGVFNTALVEKVGANKFIAKFDPDIIVQTITDHLEELASKDHA